MTTVTAPTTDLFGTPSPDAAAEPFAERVMACLLGADELLAVYLGDRLGWYRALRDHGPATSDELARRTGTAERYAREWLEHQAASGYLAVTTADRSAPTGSGERRYALLPGAAEVLTDEDSPLYLAPQSRFVAAAARSLDALVHAYRHGGGVGWAELGVDAREAQAHTNRPLFLHHLAQDLLPAVQDLDARLRAGARVADVGCGEGWSGIGLALAHAGVSVDGYDVDEPSVAAARRHAAEAGVADRVRFRVAGVRDVRLLPPAPVTTDHHRPGAPRRPCRRPMRRPGAGTGRTGRSTGHTGGIRALRVGTDEDPDSPSAAEGTSRDRTIDDRTRRAPDPAAARRGARRPAGRARGVGRAPRR
jgi:hypothetical protein